MDEVQEPAPTRSTGRGSKALLALVGVAALLLVGRLLGNSIESFQLWVEGLGPWGPFAFILGYIAAVVAFAPASLLTLAAGGIFGLWRGALFVFVAATLGSTLAFLIARYLARAAVQRRIEGDPRFAAIDRAIAREGRKIAFLLRLSPVFPFNLLNYALGLTGIRLGDYVIASLGMIPGTFLYVYLGYLAAETAAAAGGAQSAELGTWIVRLLGAAATVAVTLRITLTARRALREATGEEAPR